MKKMANTERKNIENMKSIKNIKLTKRDYLVLENIYKFGFCLSRHVQALASFPSSRTTDRRLSLLTKHGYLERQKIIYGIPYIYYLTRKGKNLIGKVPKVDKIKLDIISHNIGLLDYLPTILKYLEKENLSIDDMVTEKELHSLDSFNTRRHHPDLAFLSSNLSDASKKIAFEFELTLKSKERLISNIEKNYLDYHKQVWIVPKSEKKIIQIIESLKDTFTGIEVITFDN